MIELKPFPEMNTVPNFEGGSMQDGFVLSVLDGMRSGSFLELGACRPKLTSNTYVLEKFDWMGLMVEIDENNRQGLETREAELLICDAVEMDYEYILKLYFMGGIIDYLSLDLDPPLATFDCLRKIPFDDWQFRVITFETDYYREKETRGPSRDIFRSHGYYLAHGDVKTNDGRIYEDWWVHPDLVDMERL